MKIEPFPGELTKQMVSFPFVTKTGKHGCQRGLKYMLTDEQKDWLCKWYPVTENSVLSAVSGIKFSTLHRMARLYGLKKSEKGLHGIMKRQAKKCKKICEANGWYASLRGKRPSAACLEATAKMWKDVREGRRLHPMKIIKRENPRRYKRLMEKRSKSRKELIKKETIRMLYGMERQTRLKCIVMQKYTRQQVCSRYNALKKGYIIYQDCSEAGGERYNIYYDDLTERSLVFEENLKKRGFRVIEYQPAERSH